MACENCGGTDLVNFRHGPEEVDEAFGAVFCPKCSYGFQDRRELVAHICPRCGFHWDISRAKDRLRFITDPTGWLEEVTVRCGPNTRS